LLPYFWIFLLYSFAGFVLETLGALAMQGALARRNTLVLLPLCPVYGLGACALYASFDYLPPGFMWIFLAGAVLCTAVEYAFAYLGEALFRVRFWDYDIPGSLHRRVNIVFSVLWGALAVLLRNVFQPLAAPLIAAVPSAAFWPCLLALAASAAVSAAVFARRGRGLSSGGFCPVVRAKESASRTAGKIIADKR